MSAADLFAVPVLLWNNGSGPGVVVLCPRRSAPVAAPGKPQFFLARFDFSGPSSNAAFSLLGSAAALGPKLMQNKVNLHKRCAGQRKRTAVRVGGWRRLEAVPERRRMIIF